MINIPPSAPDSSVRRIPPWRRPVIWILLLLVIGITAAVFAVRSQQSQTPQDENSGKGQRRGAGAAAGSRPLPVVTAVAKSGDINLYLNGLGSVLPLNTVTVKPHVDGQLMKIFFHEGQVVKRDAELAEIDPRPYQVLLTQAEGQMARDQALLKNAQVDLERYQTLFKQDSIAKQQLDTQQSLVRQYEAAIKIDRGQIDSAQLQLTYAHITAPIGGRLGLRQVDPGNMVHASDTNGLVVITQLQPITVLFTIPEDSIPDVMQKLQNGDKLKVDIYDRAQKNKLASGLLLTVDNQIDTTTGTVKLKAKFDNDDFSLFPNQFVNARMLVDVKHGVTLIPTAGIQHGTQGTFVYLVQADQSVTLRTIKVGAAEGDNSEIENGLAAGDQIVVDGADKLREGSKVQVPSAAGATPAQTGKAGGTHGSGRKHRRDSSASQTNASQTGGA